MNLRLLAVVLLAALVAVAGFGLYMPTTHHHGHVAGCLFALGGPSICAPLTHLEHWQSAFVSILVEVFVLAATFFVCRIPFSAPQVDPQFERYRFRIRSVLRSLLQELFSRGILNPKVP